MSYRPTEIGNAVTFDPARAARAIAARLRDAGSIPAAADAMGIASSTLYRWVAVLQEKGHDPREVLDEQQPAIAAMRDDPRGEGKRLVSRALAMSGGNLSGAAAELGVAKSTVHRWVADLGLRSYARRLRRAERSANPG